MSTRDSDGVELGVRCGCLLFLTIFNLLVGGWSVNYLLEFFANKVIPFGWAMVIGLFAGEASIPAAIVVWILHMFHII